MAPLAEPLFRGLEAAADVAEAHLLDFDMTDGEYQSGQSHLARAHARRLLKRAEKGGQLPPRIVAAPQPNLQICIAHQLLTLRMLRPDRLQVPKAGPNAARAAYFSNRHAQLFGIKGSRLIGLWGPNDLTGEMQVRVVRTIGEVHLGLRHTIDIDFWLPRSAEGVDALEFQPIDDDMNVELPFEDEREAAEESGGVADDAGR